MKSLRTQLSIATLGNGLEKLIALVVVTVLIHYVEKALMGQFFFAVSVCTGAALVNEFGTGRYLIRAVAHDESTAAACLAHVLRFRLPLMALTFIAINGVVAVVARDMLWIFVFVSIYVLFDSLYYAFGSTLLGIGALGARVATGLIGPLCLLLLVPAASLLQWSFERIVVLYAVATVAMAVISFFVVVRHIGKVKLFASTPSVRTLVSQCAVLFAVNISLLLHSKIDEWMLAGLRDFHEVAGYAAAYKLAEVSRAAIRPVTMVLFPVFAAAAGRAAWGAVRKETKRALMAALLIGVAVAACVIAVAPLVVPLLFGPDYPESVNITRVLFLATPAVFVASLTMSITTSLHLDREVVYFAAASILLNAALNLAIIPAWGAIGAAWTTLVTETLFCIAIVMLLVLVLRRKLLTKS